MKVALVHDYLREYGGAERVIETLHEMWPDAPLYTSFVDRKALGARWVRFADWDIRTSWVQKNWFVKMYHSPLRFLAPKIWESFDLSAYDVVISSSGWFMCRGVQTGNDSRRYARYASFAHPSSPSDIAPLTNAKEGSDGAQIRAPHRALYAVRNGPLHICYIHHPPRNLYGYATGSDLQKYWPVRVYTAIVNFFLRHYDFETAQRVDYIIANSKETAKRVWKFYRRDSTVMYPPVEILKGHPLPKQGVALRKTYFLCVGRLTYSKRVDLAIEAANKLKYVLKIVGTGREEANLRKIASQGDALRSRNIEFLGAVSDSELADLYAGAKALIFCALDEDFGMVPVEAMAYGVPVIALGQGGVLETVIEGKTGVLFDEPTVESLVGAMKRFERMKSDWSKNCVSQAQKFSKVRFQKELKAFVKSHIGK